MVNFIWAFFIIAGIIYGVITNNYEVLNTEILESSKTTLEMVLKMFPLVALWTGIMNIAKESKLLDKFSKAVAPILGKLFPEIPKGHESLGYIASNIVINMFGLGNAATPFGLKAMKSLQEINKDKTTASRSMITFLVLNTTGFTLIPTTVISLRMMHGSANPTDIVITSLIATTLSTVAGLIIDRIVAKKRACKK
ncbi:MAG: spore maturation protein [Bacilli bacterium]|nr:spore maturation protein [Bacilli bacterium]